MPSTLALAARGGRLATMTIPQYRYARAAVRYGPGAARAAGRIAKWAYRRYRSRRAVSGKPNGGDSLQEPGGEKLAQVPVSKPAKA